MCTIEKEGMRENLPSAVSASQACEECVNPQTEREKIGHFHIYSSVRSRAVYREKQGGREEGGLQPQELWGFTSLPLSLFYLWTCTLSSAGMDTQQRQTEEGREEWESLKEIGEEVETKKQGCAVFYTQKKTKYASSSEHVSKWAVNATNQVMSLDLKDTKWGWQTGRDLASLWRRINSGHMRRRIDKPSST